MVATWSMFTPRRRWEGEDTVFDSSINDAACDECPELGTLMSRGRFTRFNDAALLQVQLPEHGDHVGQQRGPIRFRRHQNQVHKAFRHAGAKLGRVAVRTLRILRDQFVDVTVQAVGHGNSSAYFGNRTNNSNSLAYPLRWRSPAFLASEPHAFTRSA